MKTRRVFWILTVAVAAAVGYAGAFLEWASPDWSAQDRAVAEKSSTRHVSVPAPAESLKVMTWNIGFGGGVDGTPTGRYTAAEAGTNIDAVAAQIRSLRPDIVFVQEIDRPSSRTGMIDEADRLARGLDMPWTCFVPTWKSRYVPFPFFPPSAHIGAVHSGQAVFSRFPIKSCTRTDLPQPESNGFLYNRFYLHRALQHAVVDVGGGRRLDAINVHLEAFDERNRQTQAEIVVDYVRGLSADRPLILAGDFNSLPPFSTKTKGFSDEDTDFSNDTTIDAIREVPGLREVIIDDVRDYSETAFFTFPTSEPTRRLDYIFYRGAAGSSNTSVIHRARNADHLPIFSEIRL